jgi:hypothetical protein
MYSCSPLRNKYWQGKKLNRVVCDPAVLFFKYFNNSLHSQWAEPSIAVMSEDVVNYSL